jgi:tellurite resistance protein
MALSVELEWTLTACGLVALADGVLRGGEAGRVLDLVHEHLPPADADAWIDRVSSRAALEQHADALPAPPAAAREGILRRAWSMALVDGDGSPDEARALERLGERLGVARDEVTTWRKLWTAEAVETASHVAAFAALLLHRRAAAAPEPGSRPGPAEREGFARLLARLPLSEPRRQRLHRLFDDPGSIEDLGSSLLWLGPGRREEVLREIAAHVRTGGHGGLGRQLFLALAARTAVADDEARRYLDP